MERDSQKGIIIGAKGAMLKQIGTAARQEMEALFGRKIFLELFVKVRPKWRENPEFLNAVDWRSMTGPEVEVTCALLSVVLCCRCSPRAARPSLAQHKISDDQIHDEVRRKLADDTAGQGRRARSRGHEGVVTLSGKVKSAEAEEPAESLTKKVKGVTKVVNKLVLDLK